MNIRQRFAVFLAGATLFATPAATLAASNDSGPAPQARHQAGEKFDQNTKPKLGGRGIDATINPFAAPQFKANQQSSSPATPECPPELMNRCHFVPAAYTQNNPNDKSDYGNYDLANRPAGGLDDQPGTPLAINSIVIHDTEGSLSSTLAAFQDPTFYASSHYVIDTDGSIYQTVANKDIAWHAGNWYVNQHSIGIEHVGHATNAAEFTPAMYQSSATLVRWLASKYQIPLDRQHILGHDNIMAPTPGLIAGMHWDPAAFWNWEYYFTLLGKPVVPTAKLGSQLITIAPHWMINRPTITSCAGATCTDLPSQSANFIYLHTQPSDSAPLISDPKLHPDGSAGTTHIDDWSAHATFGQQFVVAQREGDWVGVYYGGQNTDGTAKVGWFHNPYGFLNAIPANGTILSPKAGLASIPVYGRAYPETSAYAGTQVPQQSIVALGYAIPAGAKYASSGLVPTDYYWAWNIDASLPDDHTTTIGQDRYYEIQFNHRVAYVKASDVDVVAAQ